MPVHDWTWVDSGLFHAFHQHWISAISDALNGGVLPSDFFALRDRNTRPTVLNFLPLTLSSEGETNGSGGLAVGTAPPQTRIVRRSEADIYAAKADLITVRHRHGDVVAVIEIVSPGNKASRAEFNAFVEKSAALI